METETLVAVVDDDESVRESLPDMLRELGYAAIAFASAEALLSYGSLDAVECLILDVGLPGLSGPQLRRELVRLRRVIPTVFITGGSEASFPTGLQKHEAVRCLLKPFGEQRLRSALEAVLCAD